MLVRPRRASARPLRRYAWIRAGLIVVTSGVALTCAAPAARAQTPTWPTSWISVGACAENEPSGDENPDIIDLVGSSGLPAAFVQFDSNFLYLRERLLDDPTGGSNSWVVLVQIPGGNAFQYQWLIAVDGNVGQVQLWQNTSALNISFTPIFNDPAETMVFSGSASTLSRVVSAGSSIGGSPNYFIDWAVPRSELDPRGIDAVASLYWFATSANSNNFNKDRLNCPFSPVTTLGLSKSVDPSTISTGATTPVTYTVVVSNTGPHAASGVVVKDTDFPSWLVVTSVSSTSGTTSFTASSFQVMISTLGIGASATITVTASATPPGELTFTNTVSAFATNAATTTAMASLVALHPTNTPTRTPTFTATRSPTASSTPFPTASSTSTATASTTATRTATETEEPTATATATRTATEMEEPTATATATRTATETEEPTPTATETATQAATATATATAPGPTQTPSRTRTNTPTGSPTATQGPPTITNTPTITPTFRPPICEEVPAIGCRRPLKANKRTLFVKLDAAQPKKNRFTYEWRRGDAIPGDFGQPEMNGGTALNFCIYHTAQRQQVVGFDIMPGGTCDGKPCWKKKTSANGLSTFKYRNRNKDGDLIDGAGPGNSAGVYKTRLREGFTAVPPDARMIVKAKAAKIPSENLPAGSSGQMFDLPVLVQVQAHDNTTGALLPVCWESEYSTPANIRKNTATKFKAFNDSPAP